MLPHTQSAVSAFPEDDVGRPTQFASKTGVGTTGLFLCSNETNLVSFLPPICIAHTVAVLLHDFRAVYDPPSTSLVCAIHHTILVITVSCKGQLVKYRDHSTTEWCAEPVVD